MKYIKKHESFFLSPLDLKEIMRIEYLSICNNTDPISKYEVSKVKNLIVNNYLEYKFSPYYSLKVKLELNKLFIRLKEEVLTYPKKYSVAFETKLIRKETVSISIIKKDDYYYICDNNKFYKCDQLRELLIYLKELMNKNTYIIKKPT
jgi:hypothetical protein